MKSIPSDGIKLKDRITTLQSKSQIAENDTNNINLLNEENDESSEPGRSLDQKKLKFYEYLDRIKETRLIETLCSLKSKDQKQEIINLFSVTYHEFLQNIISIRDHIKQINFTKYEKRPDSNSFLRNKLDTSKNPNINPLGSIQSGNQNQEQQFQKYYFNDPHLQIQGIGISEQIIKDCKQIHNAFVDLIEESSLKHLVLCCEIFQLDGTSIDLQFKISTWYKEINGYIQKTNPLLKQNNSISNKSLPDSNYFSCLLCSCFCSNSNKPYQYQVNLPLSQGIIQNQNQERI